MISANVRIGSSIVITPLIWQEGGVPSSSALTLGVCVCSTSRGNWSHILRCFVKRSKENPSNTLNPSDEEIALWESHKTYPKNVVKSTDWSLVRGVISKSLFFDAVDSAISMTILEPFYLTVSQMRLPPGTRLLD